MDTKGNSLPKDWYEIDYANGTLHFSEAALQQLDSVQVAYLRYPLFLTRKYSQLDPGIIVENTNSALEKLYALDRSNTNTVRSPFEGLNTQGSITRGITVGNNQNAVVNSELDLQITGRLSDKVSIRASLQDANIPTQEGVLPKSGRI